MRANEDPAPINVLTNATIENINEQLDAYYKFASKRCKPDSARLIAIGRLRCDLEELTTNWEISKS